MPPPPRPSGGGARGRKGPPHCLPPPPHSGPRADGGRPKKRRPRTPPEEAAAPGVRGHHGRGRRPDALPAAGRRRTGGAEDGANGAALSEAGPGKTRAQTRAGGFPPPPPPPPCRTDPLAADQAAPDARGHPATPTARVYHGEARRRQRMARRRPTGRGGGGAAPPTPPPAPPPQLGSHRSDPPPPRIRGGAPPPPQGTATRGGGDGARLAHRAPQRPQPLPRGSRPLSEPGAACRSNARTKLGGGARRRTRTVWRPRPT